MMRSIIRLALLPLWCVAVISVSALALAVIVHDIIAARIGLPLMMESLDRFMWQRH